MVASVLPPDAVPDRLPLQPEAGIVRERITSPLPLLVALLADRGWLFALLAWWWRRRGRSRWRRRARATARRRSRWRSGARPARRARWRRWRRGGFAPGDHRASSRAPPRAWSRRGCCGASRSSGPPWPAEEIGHGAAGAGGRAVRGAARR